MRDGLLGYVLVIQPQTTLGRTLNERQANIRRRVVLFVGLYLHMCGLGRVLRNGYRPDRCAFYLQLMKAGRLQLLAQVLKGLSPLPRVQNALIKSRCKLFDVEVRWHASIFREVAGIAPSRPDLPAGANLTCEAGFSNGCAPCARCNPERQRNP